MSLGRFRLAENLRVRSDGATTQQLFQPRTSQGVTIGPLANEIMPILLAPEKAPRLACGYAQLLECLTRELAARGIIVPEDSASLAGHLNSLAPLKLAMQPFFAAQQARPHSLPDTPHVAILGVPCDLGASKPGTRYGPDLLREVTANLIYRGGLFSLSERRHVPRDKLFDIGDLNLERAGLDCWLESLESVVASLPAASIPFTTGGDHTFTLSVIKALYKKRQGRPFVVVQLDSHLDLQVWGEFTNGSPTVLDPPIHSNFVSHVLDCCPGVRFVQIGARHYQSIEESLAQDVSTYLSRAGTQITDLMTVRTPTAELTTLLPEGEDVYLTFDVDVLSSPSLSSTGYPNPTGLTSATVAVLLDVVGKRNTLIGADVMEFGKNHQRDAQRTETELVATMMTLIVQALLERST